MSTPDPASMPAYQKERRAGIVRAAQELLGEDDPRNIHVRDVAARAGVSLGTVYRYFGSKEVLYAVALREWGEPGATPARVAALPPADRFRARLRYALKALTTNPGYFRVVLLLRTSSDPAAITESRAFADALTRPILDDLAALGEREAHEVALMAWCLLTDLLAQRAQGAIDLDTCQRTLETFSALVRTRLETAGE